MLFFSFSRIICPNVTNEIVATSSLFIFSMVFSLLMSYACNFCPCSIFLHFPHFQNDLWVDFPEVIKQ